MLDDVASKLGIGVYLTNAEGHCTYVSPGPCELLVRSRKRLVGLGWIDCVHPEDRAWVRNARLAAIGSRNNFELRFRLQLRSGKSVPVVANSVALLDNEGRFVGRIGFVRPAFAGERAPKEPADRKMAELLTRQEWRVLSLLMDGKTNREIAAALRLSGNTVKNYLSNAFQKLEVKRRSQAAVVFAGLRAQSAAA